MPLINQNRIQSVWLVSLTSIAFVYAAARQTNLQMIRSGAVLQRAKDLDRYVQTVPDPARRGAILSADGQVLAEDADVFRFSLQYGKGSTPASPSFFAALSEASGIPPQEFETFADSALAQGVSKVKTWPEPIDAERARAIQAVRQEWRADGVSLGRASARTYPYGQDTSSVVGLATGGKGLRGLELGMNPALQGVDGSTTGLLDRTGSFLPMRIEDTSKRRIDGKTITLTMDMEIQTATFEALKSAVVANAADSGTAVVMDPKTGDVLAMASYPTFDPSPTVNKATKKVRQLGVNAAIEQRLEPGSTFKILTLAKAMDMGVVHPGETIYCSGELKVGKNSRVRCDDHHGVRAHGLVTPMMAIARSCNVSAATWAERIGHDAFVQYIHDLGLMDRVAVGLPHAAKGHYVANDPARALQLATFGFGQSMAVTPLSLADAFCSLANGGVRMKPRMVAKIGDKPNPTVAAGRIVSPQTANTIVDYMVQVIDSEAGTGHSLEVPGYRLAGKTGTAQKVGFGEGYVANFVGFVPATQTRAVILVMIDHPTKGAYYGALVAGPVFRSIAEAVIRRYHLPQDEPAAVPSIAQGSATAAAQTKP